ncbi:hypothetical protein [Cryptosporangium sp. NPDC051539]|uniref:hypothetical protein n=1 Tax=Cryptosporangium sp. NPDC051539 TaxID=3363962 RepID=UPI0037B87DC5
MGRADELPPAVRRAGASELTGLPVDDLLDRRGMVRSAPGHTRGARALVYARSSPDDAYDEIGLRQ